MDSFTRNILNKLRLIISLKLLHSEENVKKIYREIAKVKTPGMLLEAIERLPEEEAQIIWKILNDKEEKVTSKPLKHQKNKNIIPAFSFKFSDGDFKIKQRLEALDRIKKSKLKRTSLS